MLIDSHCHLDFPDFRDDLDAVVARLSGFGLRSLQAHPPTLEELFLRQYGEEATR